MPVIPRTRFNSLERIAGMWPCLHPALRKKKKILAQTFATGLGGVAHFTLKLPHPVPSVNESGRRERQSASRDAEFRPITSSQVRDYRGWFAVEPSAQRFPCQSWDGATVDWDRGPGVANLRRWVFRKGFQYCFYVVKSGNTLPFGLFLGNKRRLQVTSCSDKADVPSCSLACFS